MISKFNKWLLVAVAIFVAASAFYIYRRSGAGPKVTTLPRTEVSSNSSNKQPLPTNSNSQNNDAPVVIPDSLFIEVPFTPQAPTANWDELHNEACEEASIIMASAYFNKYPTMSAPAVEKEIAKLTSWQIENQGYNLDQTSEEVAKMIIEVYKLKAEVVPLSKMTVKKALLDNKLVIISFDGRDLNNPHFKPPGPKHHMLVLTGWTADNMFITNDPGTKFGENYEYDYETLETAAGDWEHFNNSVDTSKKLAIIVSK